MNHTPAFTEGSHKASITLWVGTLGFLPRNNLVIVKVSLELFTRAMSLDSRLQPPLCRSSEIKICCIEPNSLNSPTPPTTNPHAWKMEICSFSLFLPGTANSHPTALATPPPSCSAPELMSSNLIHFLDKWSKYLANIIYDFVINKPFTEVIQGVLGNFKDNFQQVSKVGSAWDTEPIVFCCTIHLFWIISLTQLQSALNGLAVLLALWLYFISIVGKRL